MDPANPRVPEKRLGKDHVFKCSDCILVTLICVQVVTLTKHRGHGRPDDEQLHVLPLCILDYTDELGSAESQRRKVADGSVECLRAFPMTARLHQQPVMCKRKRLKMAALARAAAGIVSRRGRRKTSSLNMAAASVLRVAAHSRPVSASRARGLKLPRRCAVPGIPQPTDAPSAPNWAHPQLNLYQAAAESYKSDISESFSGNHGPVYSGLPLFAAQITQTIPPNESLSQNGSHPPPPSYASLFPSYGTDAVSLRDASVANGYHVGVLRGSANLCRSAYAGHGDSQCGGSNMAGLSAGNNAVQCVGVRQRGGGSLQRAYSPRVFPASATLLESANVNCSRHSTRVWSGSQYSVHSRPWLHVSASVSAANACNSDSQAASQQLDISPFPLSAGDHRSESHFAMHGVSGRVHQLDPALSYTTAAETAGSQSSGYGSSSNAGVFSWMDAGSRWGTKQTSAANSLCPPTADDHTRVYSVDEQSWHFPLEMLSSVAERRPRLPEIGPVGGRTNGGDTSNPVNSRLFDVSSMQPNSRERVETGGPALLQQPPLTAESSQDTISEDRGASPLEIFCDNAENFRDGDVGGVALALTHGSILFEVAKRELHATTALRNPSRAEPTRISLVFYQHRNLNAANHGRRQFEQRVTERRQTQCEGTTNTEASLADLHSVQDNAGVDGKALSSAVGHLQQPGSVSANSIVSGTQVVKDRHLPHKGPVVNAASVDFGDFGTETLELAMKQVPTADELAEVSLGDLVYYRQHNALNATVNHGRWQFERHMTGRQRTRCEGAANTAMTSLADQHLLPNTTGVGSSRTPPTAVGRLWQDDVAVDCGIELAEDQHLPPHKGPAVDFGNRETERVELVTENVPTVDELAEVKLTDQ